MKTSFLFLFSVLLFSSSFCQNDYIKYNQLVTKARKIHKEKKSDSTVILLEKAFDLVDFVHIENLKFGKKVAKKYNSKSLLNYCKNVIEDQNDSIDYELKVFLDSLVKEDQRVRSSKYYKAHSYYRKCLYDSTFAINDKKRIVSKTLMEEWRAVDSSNVEELKKVIVRRGFPSEKVIGKKTNVGIAKILLHYDKDTSNHIMGEDLRLALEKGCINPKDYAWIIDRHLMNAGNEQMYQIIPTPWIDMTDEKRKYYNRNRFSIGLKSLDEIKVIVKKNSVKVKY